MLMFFLRDVADRRQLIVGRAACQTKGLPNHYRRITQG